MNGNGVVKTIGLVMTGTVLIGGAIASAYKAAEESRVYTDDKISELKEEQGTKIDKIQEDVGDLKQNVAIIKTLLEERFGRREAR